MKRIRKTLLAGLLVILMLTAGTQTAYAQLTILPYAGNESGPFSLEQCQGFMNIFESDSKQDLSNPMVVGGITKEQLLGCAIMTGRIALNMIPFYITYVANFLLSLVGLICVLFIVIGGYFYIYGGLSEQKEKGKKTIYHALFGMVLAILSWVIVNLIMTAVTS